jgi:hypothetical protein
MSKRPDFLERSCGLFLCVWPSGWTGKKVVEYLYKHPDDFGSDNITVWEPFQDNDNETVAGHIEDHAQTLERYYDEDLSKWKGTK